ncbi:MAG TPA: ribonuclease III domain-containing protein [Chroococcales cyanobacterium]
MSQSGDSDLDRSEPATDWFLGTPLPCHRAADMPLRLLAHLGDAVFHLYEREREVAATHSVSQMHKRARVNAQKQCELLNQILAELTENEKEIVRRARNIKPSGYRKIDQATYRQATAFEALLGYLYIENQARLKQVLALTAPAGTP